MAINEELTRIKNAKEAIKTSIEAKGVTVGDGTIDTYASKIDDIPSGGSIDEYFSDTISSGSSSNGGWEKSLLKFRSPLKVNGTSTVYMFCRYPLSEIPQIDTSNVTDMSYMFQTCPNLITIPQLDTNNVTSMKSMFYGCSSLTTIPLLDTNNVTDMNSMFMNCSKLTTISHFNTVNVTDMAGMFQRCSSLTSIPQLDTSNVTDISGIFYGCSALTSIPQLDTSKVTNMNSMFSNCTKLASVPQLVTTNVTNVSSMFDYCRQLRTIPLLDFGKVNNLSNTFRKTDSLTDLDGFQDLGKAYSTTQSANYYDYKLDLSMSINLTHASLMNVINNLYNIASKGCNPQQLVLGETNLAKLTEEEIAIATTKGWTVS